MENWDYEKQSVTVEAIRLDGNYFGGQSDQLKTAPSGVEASWSPEMRSGFRAQAKSMERSEKLASEALCGDLALFLFT